MLKYPARSIGGQKVPQTGCLAVPSNHDIQSDANKRSSDSWTDKSLFSVDRLSSLVEPECSSIQHTQGDEPNFRSCGLGGDSCDSLQQKHELRSVAVDMGPKESVSQFLNRKAAILFLLFPLTVRTN